VLQARQSNCRFSFVESAKLVKTTGEPLRALQELENAMRPLGLIEKHSDVIDLTDDDEMKKMKAKVHDLCTFYSTFLTVVF
jgi:serine/threonine-protein kinase ATR